MATKKRKTTTRRAASRKKRAEQRLPAGLGTLFAGLLLVVLAFVEGDSAWKALHDVLFGLFGCGSFVLGAAVCCLAVQYTRGEDLLPKIFKLVLGLVFACGTVIVFSDIQPQGMSAFQMTAACYANGVNAWIGGGALGALLGGSLLLLCGRPAATLIMIVLALCVSLYIFDLTPAEVWQWLCAAFGGVHAKGAAMAQQSAARRAERAAARAAEAEAEEDYDEAEDEYRDEEDAEEEMETPAFRIGMPDWLNGIRHWGHKVTEEMEAEEPEAAPQPIVQDAVETDASDFFAKAAQPVQPAAAESFDTPVMTPAMPTAQPESPAAAVTPEMPAVPIQPAVPAAPARVSAENAVAMRGTPDEDGWISITSEPVEEKDISTLVAAAMEKPAASEQAAAAAPVDETEPVDTYQYQYPPIELFEKSQDETDPGAQEELKANAQKLVDTLESFGVRTRVLDISRGPSVTRYEVQPMAGVKISRITSLADDIALNLAVADVRMEAPIPGKPAVGIEVPNHKKTPVYIRSVFESQSFLRMTSPLGIALGKDIAGVAQVADLCKMPHLLIAGSTGSGKSVCVNSIIMSLLFRSSPEDVKLLLIDPKVVELAEYNGIPHLLMPVVTEPKKAAGALGSAVQEMERRYHLFAENNVRDIKSFNKLAAERPDLEKMPYIAIIIDELADLMMVVGKDVEDSICRIAQKARAAGMHLIVATQRPSVDVITGLIKANIPSRIAFAVSSQVDSRTILDGSGAEKLLGMGDMLFMPVGAPKPTRIQGTFVRDEEISRVLDFIKQSGTVQYDEAMIEAMEKHAIQDGKKGSGGADSDEDPDTDPMFKQAVEVVIDAGQASTSLLQRRCKLGYARAARIMDEMEQKGIIGPYEGAKPRAVLISRQQWLEMQMNQPEE